jgi:hypothetical protein
MFQVGHIYASRVTRSVYLVAAKEEQHGVPGLSVRRPWWPVHRTFWVPETDVDLESGRPNPCGDEDPQKFWFSPEGGKVQASFKVPK